MTAVRALSAPRSRLKPYSARLGQPEHYAQPAHYPTREARRNARRPTAHAIPADDPTQSRSDPHRCKPHRTTVSRRHNARQVLQRRRQRSPELDTGPLHHCGARRSRHSPTIPSLRRSDRRTPGTSTPSAGRQKPGSNTCPDPTGPDLTRPQHPRPSRIGLGRSTARQPSASANRTGQRGQSDPGTKAARVKGRPRAGAPLCEPLRSGWSTCPKRRRKPACVFPGQTWRKGHGS